MHGPYRGVVVRHFPRRSNVGTRTKVFFRHFSCISVYGCSGSVKVCVAIKRILYTIAVTTTTPSHTCTHFIYVFCVVYTGVCAVCDSSSETL